MIPLSTERVEELFILSSAGLIDGFLFDGWGAQGTSPIDELTVYRLCYISKGILMKTYSSKNTICIIGWRECSMDQPPGHSLTTDFLSTTHIPPAGALGSTVRILAASSSHTWQGELAPEAGERFSGAHPCAGTDSYSLTMQRRDVNHIIRAS